MNGRKLSSKYAQGTIEYLVIISVVVVTGLVSVGLVTGIVSGSGSGMSPTAAKAAWLTGTASGLSLLDWGFTNNQSLAGDNQNIETSLHFGEYRQFNLARVDYYDRNLIVVIKYNGTEVIRVKGINLTNNQLDYYDASTNPVTLAPGSTTTLQLYTLDPNTCSGGVESVEYYSGVKFDILTSDDLAKTDGPPAPLIVECPIGN